MALYDVTTITELANLLGAAEFEIDDMINSYYHGAIMERLISARSLVYDHGMNLNSVEFDRIRQLAESLRFNETTIIDVMQDSLSLSINALDNYFRQTFAIGMRDYYDGSDDSHTVLWNDMFRQLWRREMNQELIICLATAVKTSGVWGTHVVAPGIELASGLEIKTDTTIGNSDISLAVGLTTELHEDVSSGISIAANTVAGAKTTVTYNSYSKFIDLRTISASGGTNGDSISIWVKL